VVEAWPGFSVEAGLSVSWEDGGDLPGRQMNARMKSPGGIIGAAEACGRFAREKELRTYRKESESGNQEVIHGVRRMEQVVQGI
jgi:hypothetical protein